MHYEVLPERGCRNWRRGAARPEAEELVTAELL